jgi:signal transduction histidine kinase/PAS domain-containing protein
MAARNSPKINKMLPRLLQTGGYGYVTLDPEGNIQAMNDPAARLLNIPEASATSASQINFFAAFTNTEMQALQNCYQAMKVDDESIFQSAMPVHNRTTHAAPFSTNDNQSNSDPYAEHRPRYEDHFPTPSEVVTAVEMAVDANPLEILRHTVIRTEAGWEVLLEAQTKPAEPEGPSRREVLYRTLARSLPQTSVLLFDEGLVHILAEGELLSRDFMLSWDIEGQTLDEAFPAEFVQELEPLYHAAFNGAVSVVELSYDDSHYNIFIQPVHDDEGEVLAGMCVIMDVTIFKQTENALRESEQRIRALLNALPDQIFLMTRAGKVTSLEVHSLTMFEDTHTTSVNLNDLPKRVFEELHDHVRVALNARTVSSFEYELQEGPFRGGYEARIIALEDNQEEAMIVVRDTTTLKQVQSELRQRLQELMVLSQVEAELTEQLNLGHVLTIALDAALRLSKAQAGFIATVVDDKFDEVRMMGAFPSLDLQQLRLQNDNVIAKAIESHDLVSCQNTRTPNALRSVLDTSSACIVCPIIWRDQVIAILNLEFRQADTFTVQTLEVIKTIAARTAVAIDNSRVYQQTATHLQETRILYDRVSKLENLKTEMIRIASHDLRNPLAVVLSYVGLIRGDMDGVLKAGVEAIRTPLEYLGTVEIAAQQMRKIILNILSLERIEEMAEEGNFDDFDFKKLVELSFNESRGLAQLKMQKFTRHLDVSHTVVKGDSTQLGEAITNLISNAIKYTPDRGQIEVRLDEQDDRLVFSVIDNGIGIKDSQQSRLFEPFFRAHSPEMEDIDGSGLGLHLVRKIIERHGGELFFKSVYREGSTFGFTIPYLTIMSS